MKFKNPFIGLTKFEWCLWTISVVVVTGSFVLSGSTDILTIIASLIGVTALIFVAKGFWTDFNSNFCGLLRYYIVLFQVLRRNDNIYLHDVSYSGFFNNYMD